MSTDPNADERNEYGDRESTTGFVEDTSGTPKSEVPISVQVSTPSTVMEEAARQAGSGAADGYFTPHPAATEQHSHPVIPADTATLLSVDSSGSEAQAAPPPPLSAPDRPRPYSATSSWSVQSTDSAATVTAATSAPVLPTTQIRPEFPNQSYAALQYQRHPTPHHPPTLRTRSSHPGQILTFTSAVASLHQSNSRPVGNSAPVTPGIGLFNPQNQHASSEWDPAVTPGTYASPFLHFTQRVPPKETHVADVDVDPMSGRKVINQYEIIDELGRGTHGKVKLGRDLIEDTFVAIKIVERFSKRRKLGKLGTTEDKVKKEVAILKQVRHPNVTALLEVIDDPTRKKVYIVLEWVENGQISWRVKGPKEITMLEARRYEREKSGRSDLQQEAEGVAIFTEAQKRLSKRWRRQLRTFRRVRRDAPEAWSMELLGDDESEVSDDDQLSRISTESYSSKLLLGDAHPTSRTSSPLPPLPSDPAETPSDAYLPLTSEPQTQSPSTSTSIWTGLEGTMYGPYVPSVPSSGDHSRVASVRSFGAKSRSKASTESLSQMASEILDSELDDELEYVPVMSMPQVRVALRDTVLGLEYLHFQGIIHRDIKPPNLLSTKEHRVKISDFGVSHLGRPMAENEAGEGVSEHEARDLGDEAKELAKTVGTPAFYAPELCITEAVEDAPPITKAIDVWALGVTLFCMLFARTPFVDNEFVVMRQIAEEEIYIPRKRLRPAESKPRSRPSSHGRGGFPTMPAGYRHELELSYEEISDELHELLRRMLVKDPRKRITLEEVRHHPWLVADIQEKVQWLEETDLSRQSQGKKIEVSKEDVNAAVVPLFLDRVRSGIRKVGERLGLGGKPSGRTRTHSNATTGGDLSPAPSNASTGTNGSPDGFRRSLHGDETIFSALKASREVDHPLARSVSTSPELEKHDPYSNYKGTHPQSASEESLQPEHNIPRTTPVERDVTTATTASMRTVRQSDFDRGRGESPPPSPGMPSTPTLLDSPNRLSGGWGSGVARRILQTVRERSSARSSEGRASSRGSVGSIDAHGEPSLAVSQTTVSGRVNQPEGFDEFTPTSVTSSPRGSPRASPSVSRPLSAVSSPSGDRLYLTTEPGVLSRTSSGGSVSSLGRRAVLHQSSMNRVAAKPQNHVPAESSAEDWQRAEGEHIRKLIREDEEEKELQSSFDDRMCPPSPDDHREQRPDSRRMSELDISNSPSSQETSPTGQGSQFPVGMASSTSDFGSAVSISISDPSIPSVISEASSVDPVDTAQAVENVPKNDLMSSDDTVRADPKFPQDNHDVACPPNGVENESGSGDDDYYDSSSDSDGGLVMTRRRSAAKSAPSKRIGSKTHSKERRGSAVSKKTSRSGSNNTMKKVRTRDSEEKRERSSLDASEPS